MCHCEKRNLKYIQPPVVKSCRPIVQYKPSKIPLEHDTIYKKSFINIDPLEAEKCRLPPAKPEIHLTNSHNAIKMEKDTVTNLSYPGHYSVPKQNPVIPCPRSLLGEGPIQDLTTQKHDFVVKPFSKRNLIVPPGKMMKTTAPIDQDTVQKLSFQKPDLINFQPAKSCKPYIEYRRSEVPMETDTTQKLSYQPNEIPQREQHSWAKKSRFSLPSVPLQTETTYKLSFLPNCGDNRRQMCPPENNSKLITSNSKFSSNTIYKESFESSPMYVKLEPIKPKPCLMKTDSIKMDTNTMYNMAYLGHYSVPKQNPVIPCPRSLLGEGPMQDLTTQKHDYVVKPQCRRALIRPTNIMKRTCAPLEKDTTTRLSYMFPNGFKQTVSCKPIVQYRKPEVPMETDTIQKLSYVPVYPPHKEYLPWSKKSNYLRNTLPMETDTIQKLSYAPPGRFIEEQQPSVCDCNNRKENLITTIIDTYPKAAVY